MIHRLAIFALLAFLFPALAHAGVACRERGGFTPDVRAGLTKIAEVIVLKNAREVMGGMALECDSEFELGWGGKRVESCKVDRLMDPTVAPVFAEHFRKQIETETGNLLTVDVRVFTRALTALDGAIDEDGDARARTLANYVSETLTVLAADNCPASKEEDPDLLLKLVRLPKVSAK